MAAYVDSVLASFLAGILVAFAPQSSRSEEPKQVEVTSPAAVLTYLGGERQQRNVERGDRFEVVRRFDTYYVVKDGSRQALIAISDVTAAPSPAGESRWDYVVTTANAPIVVRIGRRRDPRLAQAGEIFEVLGRPRISSTLFVLTKDGRTAEIATSLVRPAKPEERPRPPAAGRLIGPVPLGCHISIDEARYVCVDFAFAGSLAARLGLEPRTRILKVNGEEVHSAADYDRASALGGGNLRLLVQRHGMDYPEMIEYQDPRNSRESVERPLGRPVPVPEPLRP